MTSSRLKGHSFNTCPEGFNCRYAHSKEEIDYHPNCYKKNMCTSRTFPCSLKDVCPNVHLQCTKVGSQRVPMRPVLRAGLHHNRLATVKLQPSQHSIAPDWPAPSAPMLYIAPSPESNFERNMIWLPGLKDMFRRRSAALYKNCQGMPQSCYSIFGDPS